MRHNSGKTTVSAEPPPIFGRFGPGMRTGEKVKRAKNTRATLTRLWGYLRRRRGGLIATALLVTLTSGLNLTGPYLIGRAIDGYILTRDLSGLARICLLMLAIAVASSLFTWLQAYIMAGVAQRTVRDLRTDLFAALQRLPLRYFDANAHGDLMSRLTNDVENVNQVLTDAVTSIISGLLNLVGASAAMLLINPLLAAVVLTILVSMTVLLTRWLAAYTREAFRKQQAALGKLNGLVEETIGGQRVVKAYHQEQRALEEFDAANGSLRRSATAAQMVSGFLGPIMNGISNTGLAVIAGLGGYLAVRGAAGVGTIAAFVNYARQFGRPLNEIANLYNSIQSAVAGAERVFEVIDEPAEVDAPDSQSVTDLRGEVQFEDVRFSYQPGVPVLRGISLHARPGETIALIGPTGAGKTTIINLLTRFYELDSGRILIDGTDIRRLRKADLRRQLGIVLQDNFLFSGTVMENIRYGRPAATDEEVVAAAKLANAHAFVHRLPHGYQTVLSERAGNLSQGQRQMLAIARAILADPRILILDEATSSVDTRTERLIQEAMHRLMQGRTSFVIAHRLTTIRGADQILVLQQGEIVERGAHEDLIAQHGFYYRLTSGLFSEEATE